MSRYVVYDLEMCKVPKGDKRKEFGSHMELIQIGAVLLDENYEVVDVFLHTLSQSLVKSIGL